MSSWQKIAILSCLVLLLGFIKKTSRPPMKIVQGDQVFFLLEETNRMQLNREEFSLIFPIKASTTEESHHLFLAVYTYEQDANAIHVGAKFNDIPAFAEEAIFQGNKNPYPALYLYADGAHDLYYETPANGFHRATYISTLADGELLLEWKIAAIREEESDTPDIALNAWEGKKLCLILVEDLNQNGVIDKGEMHKAYITFP